MSLNVSLVDSGSRTPAARGLAGWLERTAPRGARGEVTVAIVTDATIRELNRRYRRVDKPTDVLSFPAAGPAGRRRTRGRQRWTAVQNLGGEHGLSLGEIVIGRGLAARQAAEFGHSLGTELRILALHGLLHLLGYDHEMDKGRMAKLESRLRRRAGLPLGLIARSA